MANYVLVYKGGGMAATPEEQQRVMAAWGQWFGGLGQALVDGGNPFSGQSSSIAADGSVTQGASSGLTGYSIVEADDLAGATTIARGCPVLTSGGTINTRSGGKHDVVVTMVEPGRAFELESGALPMTRQVCLRWTPVSEHPYPRGNEPRRPARAVRAYSNRQAAGRQLAWQRTHRDLGGA